MSELKRYIREIPDFPKPGILFYDITTLLKDPQGLEESLAAMEALFGDTPFDKVVGIESRGFMFAPHLAFHRGAGFVPVRKPGKLPGETLERRYELEYGEDGLQMHSDAIVPEERVLIVDDLLATGGTARATAELVEAGGGEVVGLAFLVELTFLPGRAALSGREVRSVIRYDS